MDTRDKPPQLSDDSDHPSSNRALFAAEVLAGCAAVLVIISILCCIYIGSLRRKRWRHGRRPGLNEIILPQQSDEWTDRSGGNRTPDSAAPAYESSAHLGPLPPEMVEAISRASAERRHSLVISLLSSSDRPELASIGGLASGHSSVLSSPEPVALLQSSHHRHSSYSNQRSPQPSLLSDLDLDDGDRRSTSSPRFARNILHSPSLQPPFLSLPESMSASTIVGGGGGSLSAIETTPTLTVRALDVTSTVAQTSPISTSSSAAVTATTTTGTGIPSFPPPFYDTIWQHPVSLTGSRSEASLFRAGHGWNRNSLSAMPDRRLMSSLSEQSSLHQRDAELPLIFVSNTTSQESAPSSAGGGHPSEGPDRGGDRSPVWPLRGFVWSSSRRSISWGGTAIRLGASGNSRLSSTAHSRAPSNSSTNHQQSRLMANLPSSPVSNHAGGGGGGSSRPTSPLAVGIDVHSEAVSGPAMAFTVAAAGGLINDTGVSVTAPQEALSSGTVPHVQPPVEPPPPYDATVNP